MTPPSKLPAETGETVPAGCLPPWDVGTLPSAPRHSARDWASMIGPGIIVAGSSIGAGEWLFGPAVTAQFGGTFLWLALISIVTQVFYNLEVMRYTLYCGEPIFVGFFRVAPGPKFWTGIYLTLCVAHIWPFMASNAAVPLASAILGHLPGNSLVTIAGVTLRESALVKGLGYCIFLLAFLPLIFGGKIYLMLERMMVIKLTVVLGFLVTVAVLLITPKNAWEVFSGFFRFGQAALRAPTVIAGRHFQISEFDGGTQYRLSGTYPETTGFDVIRGGKRQPIPLNDKFPQEYQPIRERLQQRAGQLVKPDRFLIEQPRENQTWRIEGTIDPRDGWHVEEIEQVDAAGRTERRSATSLTGKDSEFVSEIVANQGFVRRGMIGYWQEHHRLPPLDFPLLAAFAAIAGAGMLSNALFSNYARDKGWGMGAQTGAIPSAIGGHHISLSDVGKVFTINEQSLTEWRGWYRHVLRDQWVWMFCSVIGLALPCMLSLQFIRNAPVAENRVAALTAEGLASRFPDHATFWWAGTLFVGFMVLAPNAVFAGDLIARLWTDLIWIGTATKEERPGSRVIRIYYGILAIYCVWGLLALSIFEPMQIAKMGAVLGNVALGFSAFHTLWVNRTLLPQPLRPNALMQLGLVLCGTFFLGITAITVWDILRGLASA